MIICPSIAPGSMAEAKKQLVEYASGYPLLEIRLDTIRDLDVRGLLGSVRPPVIATCRHAREGGSFRGPVSRQASILSDARKSGAEYIDVEYRMGRTLIEKFIKDEKRVILSYHNFDRTPHNLEDLYRKMRRYKPDIIKIAVTAREISDTLKVLSLLKLAKSERQKIIALCMGEPGEVSRIIGGKFGCFLSFAAGSPERCTGPGQIPLRVMMDVYRADRIDSHTKIFGLLGNPVRQSKGFYYHNTIFRRKGKNAVYCNFLIDNLTSFFRSFGTLLTGGSVTMPLKESIIPFLDHVETNARDISSVNTIVRRHGRWYGCNTDYLALVRILRRQTRLKGKRALILGTGAMARTMTHAILSDNGHPVIMGRSLSKSRLLAERFQCEYLPPGVYADIDVDIVVNATPVGMIGYPQIPLLPPGFYRKNMIVLDVVNRQDLTPFLSAARDRGCRIITGHELFLEQAKLQSKIFLSVCPS